jgi:hypothetical protein
MAEMEMQGNIMNIRQKVEASSNIFKKVHRSKSQT